MNKKGIKIIIQHVLARSPHQVYQKFQHLNYRQLQIFNQATDETYLDNNLSNIYCDFMTNPLFSINPQRTVDLSSFSKQFKTSTPTLEIDKKNQTDKQQKLIQIAKRLQQQKGTTDVYQEAEEVINSISSQEAYLHKQYLMHIYKWILNQKGRVQPHTHEYCEELKKVVMLKLCDAYRKGQLNQEIEDQLSRLQILAKARQFILKGEKEHAKIKYEKVFNNSKNSEMIRTEAIEFLCSYSSNKGDRSYLHGLLNRIDKEGSERHRRCVERALSQLKEPIEMKPTLEKSTQ